MSVGEVLVQEIIMPQPYSADLRERVLVAYEHGEGTQVAIAHRFRVSPATVCNWVRQARQDGRRRPKPHRGGPAGRLGPAELALLQDLVAKTSWPRPTMLGWTSMRSVCLRSPASGSAVR